MPVRVPDQQPGCGWQQDDAEHDGDACIGPAPPDAGDGKNRQKRQDRLPESESQRRQRDRAAAASVEITGHAGDRHMADQSLSGLTKQEDRDHQHDWPVNHRHERAGRDQQRTHDTRVGPKVQPIDELTGPRQQERAAERSDHVDGAPRRMAEVERVLNARPEDTDEVRLPEARRKGENEAEAQEPTVLGGKVHIRGDRHEVGKRS